MMRQPLQVLQHYLKRSSPPGKLIETRAGLKVHLSGDADDVATAILIFARRDYGPIPKGVVVDVGSNIGAFTLYALKEGATACYGFEPDPDLVEVCKRNLKQNNFAGQGFILRKAVTGLPRSVVVFQQSANASGHVVTGGEAVNGCIRVPSVTLEEILIQHGLSQVDLLKLDCEGSEYEILEHTPQSTWDKIVAVRMEYHRGQSGALTDTMIARGYQLKSWRPNSQSTGMLWFERPSTPATLDSSGERLDNGTPQLQRGTAQSLR